MLACFSKSYQFLLPVPRPTSQRCLCQGCQLKSIKEATLRLFRLTPTYLPVPACVLFLSHCCCWTTTASPSPGPLVPWSRPGLCASLYLCLAFFLLHPSPPTLCPFSAKPRIRHCQHSDVFSIIHASVTASPPSQTDIRPALGATSPPRAFFASFQFSSLSQPVLLACFKASSATFLPFWLNQKATFSLSLFNDSPFSWL